MTHCRWLLLIVALSGLHAAPLRAQVKGAEHLRVVDSATVQVVRLADGSILVGRFVSVDGEVLRFETAGGTVMIPRRDLRDIRSGPRARLRNGRLWNDDPDPTRLFFGPTARTLPKGEGDFSDTYLFLLSGGYGVGGHAQIGAGFSVLPTEQFTDNLFFVTGKVGFDAGPKVQLAVGGLVGWTGGFSDNVGGSTLGAIYGVGTFGSTDHAVTVGLAAPIGGGIDTKPVVLIGGETRIGRRVKLITENYFVGSRGRVEGLLGYGLRIFGDRIAVNLGFLNSTSHGLFPGVPYLDFVVRF